MNILITGVSGFAGCSLVSALHQVKNISLFGHSRTQAKTAQQFGNFNITILDNCSVASLNSSGIDAIIHLAGIAHDISNHYTEADYFKVNFEDTRRLYDNFLKSSASKFIFVSSVKAVADNPTSVVDENMYPTPVTPYGKSKLEAERYILNHSPNDNKVSYIVRPCMMHGPGNKGNLNLLYKFVKSGIPYPFGAFQNQRSFLSVNNFNFIIQSLLDGNVPSGVFTLADDEPLSTNDVVRLIAEVLKRKHIIINIPQGLLKTFASVGTKLHLPLNSATLQKLTESYIVSNKKIKYQLGITSLPTLTRVGLTKTIESFIHA